MATSCRNYDFLTAKSAIEQTERLRDVDDLLAVLAKEAADKAGKGVTDAIDGRLEDLVAELAAAPDDARPAAADEVGRCSGMRV